MIFSDKFSEIAEILDVRSRSYRNLKPNNADMGELFEIFIKEALSEIVSGSLRVNRGGRVVDSEGNQSKQIDIVVTQGNSLSIYADKGIYPVESVCGAFCITSTLTREKLKTDIEALASIPVDNPRFMPLTSDVANNMNDWTSMWRKRCPYRCIFAFNGEIREDWKSVLNDEIESRRIAKERMPNLVAVNKTALFQRIETAKIQEIVVGAEPGKLSDHYGFVPLLEERICAPLTLILSGLNGVGQLQYAIQPHYPAYFRFE